MLKGTSLSFKQTRLLKKRSQHIKAAPPRVAASQFPLPLNTVTQVSVPSIPSTSANQVRDYKMPDPQWAPSIYTQQDTLTYTDFLHAVESGNVILVDISESLTHAKATILQGTEPRDFKVVLPDNYDVVNYLLQNGVNVALHGQKHPTASAIFFSALPVVFQLMFIFLVIYQLANLRNGGAGGGSRGFFDFTNTKAKLIESTDVATRFDDVAGADNAKRDLQEIVDFLKNPDKYAKVGATVPKGVLLSGPPGCGKTLLARSVAGEAGVPFFSATGSGMVELFVGVAAARIRDLFQKAKEKTPCIIFIDEIDAIGKARGASLNVGGNDEREQALNQLLTEMDGFDTNNGVIVIAATNRPDVLDAALLRPGRFDRRVAVELPDAQGRRGILRVHTDGIPLANDINLTQLSKITVGFSGADLMNLCNEAAIFAARESSDTVTNHHFDQALEKVTLGEERRTVLVTEQKRKVTAYHEAGHALLGIVVGDFDAVRKVSIIPRGATGGATYFEPTEDRLDGSLVTREYLENKLVVALGGRVAEEIVFGGGKVTTGASGDFQVVRRLADEMVRAYGFNESIGPMAVSDTDFTEAVEADIRRIVSRAHSRALSLLKTHEFYLHRIAEALMDKETLREDDLRKVTAGMVCSIGD